MVDNGDLERGWLATLLAAVVIALALRLALLATSAVPFNSDEAIVGLMARHILDGARPIFFYGQAYMGSLDAWLISGVFRFLGESVFSIRVVQILLYLLFLVLTAVLATRLYGKRVGRWTAALAAVPPVLVITYTSATLGGYSEVLVLGSLTLLLGYEIVRHQDRSGRLAWLGLGLAAGLAFWTLGVSLAYIAPVVLVHLVYSDRRRLPGYGLAVAGFLLGSLPWWIHNIQHNWGALEVLLSPAEFHSGWLERLLGLAALGVPALLGLRFPWTPQFLPTPWLFAGLILYGGVFLYLIMRWRRNPISHPGTQMLVSMFVLFVIGFIATRFGVDSTGRYLLPLYIPLLIGCACAIEAAWQWRRAAAVTALAGFVLLHGYGIWSAIESPARLTTQFDEITRFGNNHDNALIEFLRQEQINAGYSNYWVTYRIAFLTDEQIILAPVLPYKPDLRYSPVDQRIESYLALARSSNEIAYVTSLHPTLDQILRGEFESAGVTYSERQIGPYHIFYDLSRPIAPQMLDLSPPS